MAERDKKGHFDYIEFLMSVVKEHKKKCYRRVVYQSKLNNYGRTKR